MWIFSKEGFISVVAHRDDKDILLIRGRVKEDIEDIVNEVEKITGNRPEIIELIQADYFYRIFISRSIFKKIMTSKIDGLTYDNFKSSIKDNERHNAYLDIWRIMYKFAQRSVKNN